MSTHVNVWSTPNKSNVWSTPGFSNVWGDISAPTGDVTLSDDSWIVDTESPNGYIVYDVNDANTGNDQSANGNPISYQILSGDIDNIFDINASTGVITIGDNTNLDYTVRSRYTLTIQGDDGVQVDTMQLTLDVHKVLKDASGNWRYLGGEPWVIDEDQRAPV